MEELLTIINKISLFKIKMNSETIGFYEDKIETEKQKAEVILNKMLKENYIDNVQYDHFEKFIMR